MSDFDYSLYRCDGCGLMGAVTRNGGVLPDCACTNDPLLRTGAHLKVQSVGEWRSTTDATGLPLTLRTVDGPPAFVWLQGRDAYGLYVGGRRVLEVEGVDCQVSIRLLNDMLAKGTVVT